MKERTLKVALVVACLCVAMFGMSGMLQDKKESKESNSNTNTNSNTPVSADAKKFKKEYEAYNNQEREDDKGNYFIEVSIPEDNPIKYSSIEEVLQILDKGTGILYFGFPTCPWCRNAVPVLLEAAKEKDINSVYYLNVNDYKNTYAIEDGKVVKTKVEKDGYYDLLDVLDDVLNPYTITVDGKTYEVGEKRIYVPFVVFVKDGTIIGTHIGTVTLEGTQTKYDALTEKQHQELLDIYLDYISTMQKSDYCDEEC